MLSQENKEYLLSEFPNIKLSYETIVHKKVYDCDLLLAIPCGIKCFTWFTSLNDEFLCVLFELGNNKKRKIQNIRIVNTCFSSSLCYGTIFYGTLFNCQGNSFFSIEDIFLYKGREFYNENWCTKLNKIVEVLKNEINQVSYNKKFTVFGLPIISDTNDKLDSTIKSDVKYKINNIQYYKLNEKSKHRSILLEEFNLIRDEIGKLYVKPKPVIIETNYKEDVKSSTKICKFIVLEVKPDIQNDIYDLYCENNNYCGKACVPDYKTSVLLNRLFRNIKENEDLDKLEESDDEDEFENENVDKFVYLEKSFKMKCVYNKRFKKWTPIEVVNNDININNIKELNNYIDNLYVSNKKK
jgi:hypothetical protein